MQAMASDTVATALSIVSCSSLEKGPSTRAMPEYTGDGAGPAGGVSADAYPDAGYFLGAEGADNGLDAVVASGAALDANADHAEWQVHVVVDDEEFILRDMPAGGDVVDGLAAEVHEGAGLAEEDSMGFPFNVYPTLGPFERATSAVPFQAVVGGELVCAFEADVMPGADVLGAGIAEADYDEVKGVGGPLFSLEGPHLGVGLA